MTLAGESPRRGFPQVVLPSRAGSVETEQVLGPITDVTRRGGDRSARWARAWKVPPAPVRGLGRITDSQAQGQARRQFGELWTRLCGQTDGAGAGGRRGPEDAP